MKQFLLLQLKLYLLVKISFLSLKVALFLLFALRTAVLILSALLDNLELIESVLKFLYLTKRLPLSLSFFSTIILLRPFGSFELNHFQTIFPSCTSNSSSNLSTPSLLNLGVICSLEVSSFLQILLRVDLSGFSIGFLALPQTGRQYYTCDLTKLS
jgi:hypothetical protein